MGGGGDDDDDDDALLTHITCFASREFVVKVAVVVE